MNQLISENSFIDTIYYKLGYKLYSFIKNNSNHSHIIINGNDIYNKSIVVQKVFKTIFKGETYLLNNEDFNVIVHKNYYFFQCDNIYHKQRFIEYIQNITKTTNCFDSTIKYIIFDKFEYLNKIIQNQIRVIIEKTTEIYRYIFLINKRINPLIKSHCISIRLNESTQYDKFIYLKYIFQKNKLSFNSFLLFEECKKYNVEMIINKYLFIKENVNMKIEYTDRLNQLIKKKLTYKTIQSIRKLSSEIKEVNIPIEIILKNIIETFTGNQKERRIINEMAKYEHLLQNSYRDLIYLETLFIQINSILNEKGI